MKKNYTPPMASAEEFIMPPTPEEEEAMYNELFFRPPLPFWKKILIYVTIWCVIIFSLCAVMWSVMQQYEAAQPWYTVEQRILKSSRRTFYMALIDAYSESANDYESLYDIACDLSHKYAGKISYKKLIREYTYENPVYLLYSEDNNLLKLTLMPGRKTGFAGIIGYSVKSVELISSDILEFKDYPLVYPKDAKVTINGKSFMPTTTNDYHVYGSSDFTVCMLENFIIPPTVRVIHNEQRLSSKVNGEYIFDYPEAKLHTVSVYAPVSATVLVNGEVLASGFKPTEVTSPADRFGCTVPTTLYEILTVAGEIDISAVKGGKKLDCETDGSVYTFTDEFVSASVTVPTGATLYANGIEIDKSEGVEGSLWRADFDGVKGVPTATEYVFENIYEIPEFTAKIGDAELTPAVDDEKHVFLLPSSEELKAEYTDNALRFMNAYLYYTTQGYSYTRRNLNAVEALVAYPSPLYKNLEASYIGYYYIAPQKMTVEYMEVDNFVPYGDDAFTCELSYKLNLTNWVGEAVEENTMRIAFARRGNTFLPVNMLLAGK